MTIIESCNRPEPERLLAVIKVQTEIVQMGLDLGNVMNLIAERTQELTQANGAVVELAEGEDMVYRASSGIAAGMLGLRLKRSGSLSGLCVSVGTPLRCDDSETDNRVDREACRRVGLRSMIVVPLKHGENVVGVLKVMSAEAARFSPADIQLLELMSELIAAAMFHAARYETSELFYRATHDALTGIANRGLFFDHLQTRLAQASRQSRRFAMLALDMDGLKRINDEYGHRAGDAAIRELANRLQTAARQGDTVARLGGDEFGVILPEVEGRDCAEQAGERLTQAIGMPFRFEVHDLPLNASLGIAIFPDDGLKIDELMDKADQTMYSMKRKRKSSAA